MGEDKEEENERRDIEDSHVKIILLIWIACRSWVPYFITRHETSRPRHGSSSQRRHPRASQPCLAVARIGINLSILSISRPPRCSGGR